MGKRYIVTYDLMAPGKDYKSLIRALERINAQPLLLSAWVVRSTSSAEQIGEYLRPFTDPNDRLVVVAIDGNDWISWNALTNLNSA